MKKVDEIDSAWRGRQTNTDHGGSRCKTILVPISLSQRSHQALRVALRLARECGARLVLVRAVQLVIVGEERGVSRWRLLQELMVSAEASLTGLARSLCKDVPFSVIVSEGPPSEVILRTASALGADAIVMGPRTAGVLKWLRRNNVRAVLSQTHCPVYIAPPSSDVESPIPAQNRPPMRPRPVPRQVWEISSVPLSAMSSFGSQPSHQR
jgi:nucleotide-binding universal stress UspA family protein